MIPYEEYTEAYVTLDEHVVYDGLREILASVKFKGTLVDIGCGYGNYLDALAGGWVEYVGVDPSAPFRALARAKAQRLGLECTFIDGVAEQLPLADNSADCIMTTFAFSELDTVDRVRQALAEIRRIARPGARLLFAELTGGVKDDYSSLLHAAEVLSGMKPYRDITDVWIEVLCALGSWGHVIRRERTHLDYTFATLDEALTQLSTIVPSLRTNTDLREKIGALFPKGRLHCELLFIEARLA